MHRPSPRALLAGLALLAIGGVLVNWVLIPRYERYNPGDVGELAAWLTGCTMIGAGLFLPFGRPVLGACLGFGLASIPVLLIVLVKCSGFSMGIPI
jgi:hypothetical protein